MKYNQERHRDLLLKNQRKNHYENLELAEYGAAVELHFLWQERDQFVLLMKDFLNKNIDGDLFCGQVSGLRRELINRCEKFNLELISNSEKIKDFQPDERSENLSDCLTGAYCECENFDDTEDYEEFYDSIKNQFLNFQQALNKE